MLTRVRRAWRHPEAREPTSPGCVVGTKPMPEQRLRSSRTPRSLNGDGGAAVFCPTGARSCPVVGGPRLRRVPRLGVSSSLRDLSEATGGELTGDSGRSIVKSGLGLAPEFSTTWVSPRQGSACDGPTHEVAMFPACAPAVVLCHDRAQTSRGEDAHRESFARDLGWMPRPCHVQLPDHAGAHRGITE